MNSWLQEPMEPIPEEGEEWPTPANRGKTTRKREIYTSEQVDTLVRCGREHGLRLSYRLLTGQAVRKHTSTDSPAFSSVLWPFCFEFSVCLFSLWSALVLTPPRHLSKRLFA